MTCIVIFRIGNVPREFTDYVEKILREFYERVKTDLVLVEVYVYGSTREKQLHLMREASELGVLVLGDFIVSHEAWRGWPRIHIDYESCRSLEKEYLEALLIHEAAHSVLHGSKLYYLVSIDYLEEQRLSAVDATSIVYMITTIVKDYEVSKYLAEKGYTKQLEKYLEYSVATWLRNSDCEDPIDTLNIVKILVPCLFMNCSYAEKYLSRECIQRIKRALSIIRELDASKRDFDEKINFVLKAFIENKIII